MTKIHLLRLVLFVQRQFKALCVDFKHYIGSHRPWYKATIVEAGDFAQLLEAMVYDQNPHI